MLKSRDRAYIAGFFDGDGCITITDRKWSKRVTINICQVDPKILYWIQEKLGFGKIYFSDRRGETNQWGGKQSSVYYLVFTSNRDVLRFIDVVYRYSRVKRRGLTEAKKYYEGR